jgi:hypothetical protein
MINAAELGKEYLLSRLAGGLCREFYQLRRGPSIAWTTCCVGSALAKFDAVPTEMVKAVLALQSRSGGWSYNALVSPDADSTLRAVQFLRKAGIRDEKVLGRAERFVLKHQRPDGGFSTYLPKTAQLLGYPDVRGWVSSHPCVTALALNLIRDKWALRRARQYLEEERRPYWWRTPLYVLYELGHLPEQVVESDDPVEMALLLLLKAKLKIADQETAVRLISLQQQDGSWPPSQMFRVPRPHQLLEELTGAEEIVPDLRGIFSTSAAIVALARQGVLF